MKVRHTVALAAVAGLTALWGACSTAVASNSTSSASGEDQIAGNSTVMLAQASRTTRPRGGRATTPLTPAPAQPAVTPVAVSAAPRAGTASAAFPTGNPQTGALLVEKTSPAEVLLGKPFETVIKVSNLTSMALQDVTLTDQMSGNIRVEEATPKADRSSGSESTWVLGELGPREAKEVRIRAVALDESPITGCATATFRPVVCTTIAVVKPAIELVKTMPAQVLQCDPIPVKLVVKNSGTSALTGVRVTDTLPEGLVIDGAAGAKTFEVGDLAPGQSRELGFTAHATRTGDFVNPAKATSTQGVEAAANASVTVVKPALAVACQTPAPKAGDFVEYIGRPFEVCWEVRNTGNAPSANTVLEVPVPAGLTLRSASDGGAGAGGKAVWNLGSLAPQAAKKVCATFSAANSGTYAFEAATAGACAEPARTSCSVAIQGVSAILVEVVDDPDPIQVGEQTTYTVRVTNQGGGMDLRDVTVKAVLPAGIDPVSASNAGQISGKNVTWAPVPALALKQTITYTVVGKAVAAGDQRLEVLVTTRERQTPITEIESTTTY
ncbi:MAG TPA: hypothetical protein PK640_15320 [Verrucomicrobiota bacterium]|nr:hypothetical protein [Verrucomicrobiota bacterium]